MVITAVTAEKRLGMTLVVVKVVKLVVDDGVYVSNSGDCGDGYSRVVS
jgi:alpha-D-ribose 1-methylphosphonate 5-triphosphate synthase subunit PhnL